MRNPGLDVVGALPPRVRLLLISRVSCPRSREDSKAAQAAIGLSFVHKLQPVYEQRRYFQLTEFLLSRTRLTPEACCHILRVKSVKP